MKTFYRAEQSAIGTEYFSPSPRKPALAVADWQRRGYDVELRSFEPVTIDQLCEVHDPDYVDGVLDGRLCNGFGDKDERIIGVLPYVAGSMVAATLHALRTGEWTMSPTSGAHHACYDHGGGFCTFNFLALAAVEAYKAGARKIAIIDCDMHYGNGTEDIIRKIGAHFISHYSFGADHDTCNPERWLQTLYTKVDHRIHGADVVIYNAGADPHVNDPLGGILTTEQLAARDTHILQTALKARVPVAISLAGGYQNPIDPVLEVHANTFRLATRYDAARPELEVC